jgi:hypothetical protein
MSTANTALLYSLGIDGFLVTDDLVAGGTTQATANRLPGALNRCVVAATNGGFMLPSILSGEGAWITFVINDSPNAIKIYPFLSATSPETQGGVANAFLSIPAGQSGIFIPVPNSKGGTLDWRSAVIP